MLASRPLILLERGCNASILMNLRKMFSTTTTTTTEQTGSTVLKDASQMIIGPRKVKVYWAKSTNPYLNLATEDYFFREGDLQADKNTQIFFWWRNISNVNVGRNQNPFKECHLQRMEEEAVLLVRRSSGGGAVYQDLGNSCFTFISPKKDHSKERNTGMVIKALEKFDILAEASGRNDLLVDGLKVSGAAYKYQGDRTCHHGTLLMNINTEAAGRYLNPDKKKLQSKGVASVQARILNLVLRNPNIDHDAVGHALASEFSNTYQSPAVPVEYLSEDDLLSVPSLRKYYDQLQDWNWRYGETPEFNHHMETRFPWGIMDVHIDAHRGLITNVKIFSDSLFPQLIVDLQEAMKGIPYQSTAVQSKLTELYSNRIGEPYQEFILEFSDWLIKEM